MKKYQVVTGTSQAAFAAAVETYLNQGWVLEGNLVLAPNTLNNTGAGQSNVTFAQAMTNQTNEPLPAARIADTLHAQSVATSLGS